ncbi:MAG TPA: hypothetical protein VM925_06110 [Labilithrix sp.]|nr:hypothetical protein [Labilithrix sp.]
MTGRISLAALGTTLAFLACDAQVGTDYEGEPQVVVPGNLLVASHATAPGQAVKIGIVWLTEVSAFSLDYRPPESGSYSGNHPYRTSTTVQVDATLPARFSLAVRDLPPSDVLAGDGVGGDKGEPYWAHGKIAALRAGADPAHVLPEDVLGVSPNAEIVYFARDAGGPTDPLSARASSFKIAPSRGYHVSWLHEDPSILATMRSCAGDDRLLDNTQYSHVCWLGHDGARQQPDPWVAARWEDDFEQCKALHDPATTLLCDGVFMSGQGPDTVTPDACRHLVYPPESCYLLLVEYVPPESKPETLWPRSAVVYDGEKAPDALVDVVIGARFFGSYRGGVNYRFP